MSKFDMPKVQITKAGEFGHGTLMFACPQCMGNDIHMIKSENKREILKWTMGSVQQETYIEHYICDGCKCEFDSESTKRKPYKFGGLIGAGFSAILLIIAVMVLIFAEGDDKYFAIMAFVFSLSIGIFDAIIIDSIIDKFNDEVTDKTKPSKNPPDGDNSSDQNG